MWARLQRFRSLDPASRGVFLRACVVMPLVWSSLGTRGFGATQATLRRFLRSANRRPKVGDGLPRDAVFRTARMVRAVARLSAGRFTCLEESLTLWCLLERQDLAASVRIGTRMNEGKFEAHAWVECQGVALHDPEEPNHPYAAFENAFP